MTEPEYRRGGRGTVTTTGTVNGSTPGSLGRRNVHVVNAHSGTLGLTIDELVERQRQERIDKIVKQYEEIIASGRRRGLNTAADLLQHWLDGSGSPKELSSRWLRTFRPIANGLETNRDRFEETSLTPVILNNMNTSVTDYWDLTLTGSLVTELYYASGTSTITSRGHFTLDRSKQASTGWVTITGTVEHHWWDPYDWHPGLAAYIPGHGSIDDADAAFLERQGYGQSFNMYSFCHQTLNATYGIDTTLFVIDNSDFEWGDIVDGRAPPTSMGSWPSGSDAVSREGNPLPGLGDGSDTPAILHTPRRGWRRRNR